MPRPKVRVEKEKLAVPDTVSLTTKERVEFVARLIADRIAEDEANDFALLQEIKVHYGQPRT